jgi:predicted ATPase
MPAAVAASFPLINLPSQVSRMLGRADDVAQILDKLRATRFVTILGGGGVGKTTVALAIARELIKDLAGAVLFFDLGALSDPDLVPSSLASMLGLSVQTDDPTPMLIAYLRERRILLILDSCEHLIEAVAILAERLFATSPQLHIVATSREALRVDGEQVYKLSPLACPPDDPELTAAVVRTYPATQLFLERAAASGIHLDISEADVGVLAKICRSLDGVPLAIELAAGRVETYGLHQTAALLDRHLSLLWLGKRSAPPRQKTLQATLNWSYELLSPVEREVLRRLAVFVGPFTLEAALAVLTSPAIDQALVFRAIDILVAKSMVATCPVGAIMRYRLLDTTRTYALELGGHDAEITDLAARHANYYRRWLEQIEAVWRTQSNAAERASYLAELNNVRAALEWCFGPDGDIEIGITLAAAAAPVFLAMYLLTECHRWSERAVLAVDEATRGGSEEMHLQAALGLSLMFTRGSSEAACQALKRSLAIAEARGDAINELQLLPPLQMFHLRTGDFRAALAHAKRGFEISKRIADPGAIALAHSLLGISLTHTADLAAAREELEAAQHHVPRKRTSKFYLGFDGHNLAGVFLARTLWLQGYPEQAMERAHQTVRDAAAVDHPVTLSVALVWAVSVFLLVGDLEAAEQHIDWFLSRAKTHSLGPYLAVGRGYKGQLAVRRHDPAGGIESLQSALVELHTARYELVTTAFNLSLAQGFQAVGRFAEAIALIDEAITIVEGNGDVCYIPELLRVKGSVLLSMPDAAVDAAEKCLMQALGLSHRNGARAYELRAATDLAALLSARGERKKARALLQPVFEQFVEGFNTTDLKVAERLLASIG